MQSRPLRVKIPHKVQPERERPGRSHHVGYAMKRALSTLVLTAAMISACASGPTIRADADPSANLASYKTFSFFDDLATDKSSYTTMLTSRLKAATQRELESRGYKMVDSNPQLLVNFNVNVQEKADVESTPGVGGYYGYRMGMYGMWAGYPQDVHTTHYKAGTLTIDVVDASKRQLVWQGVAEGRIHKSALENPGAAIDQAVADIFTKYPVSGPMAAAR